MYQEYLNQLQHSLELLTSDELKELLNNDDSLDQKVDEVLHMLRAQKDSLLSDNRNKAEQNIEKEPQITELRSQLAQLTDEGKQLCEEVQQKLEQIREKSGNVSQEAALALLQTAAAECEDESEALVKKFTDNELGVDAFLEAFLTSRKTMHLRKLKADKMIELMRQQVAATAQNRNSFGGGGQHTYNNMPGGHYYPPAPGAYPSGAGITPYPLGPMMPMPPSRPY